MTRSRKKSIDDDTMSSGATRSNVLPNSDLVPGKTKAAKQKIKIMAVVRIGTRRW